ncbi:hypothetical protein CNR22_23450 [Sphingobacteriaceae bacterium]|nr:hypothetical protein CNR22_23450 [Sphingobacteriaceae bacterium]
MRYAFLIFFVCSLGLNAFAQQKQKKDSKGETEAADKKKREKLPPENIEFFPKNFLVKVRYSYPLMSINVSNRRDGKGSKFMYLPAMPGVVGLSLKIKKVYISFGVQLPASDALKKKYGYSKFRNIALNIRGRVVQWGMFYRDYKGFYLKNYQSYYPYWNKDSLGYPKTKGLRILETGLNFNFTFNKRFSLNAALSQGERQKKSAGSFMLGFSERYQWLHADTSFVPPGQGDFYPNLDKLKYGNFLTTIISSGYGYQIVVKKFHCTPHVMLGTGIQFQSYRQIGERHLRVNIPTYASGGLQLGYNGDHFFFNTIYQSEFNTIPIKESRIRLFQNRFEIGVGMRF